MRLGYANEQIDTYSGRASENVRALAFAGLAFVWLIAHDLKGVRGDLFLAAALLLLALFADFAHYVVGALRWDRFVRRVERETEERGQSISDETPAPFDEGLIKPIYVAFYIKLGAIVVAYLALGYAVLSRF